MPFPKTPALTADCVVIDGRGRLLLIRRGHPPFKGQYALPGGFAEVGETIEDACRRLRERADTISDPDLRNHFLCDVPVHARVLQHASSWGGAPGTGVYRPSGSTPARSARGRA